MTGSGPIVFRFDATPALGIGHMRRCLGLASELQARGRECHFFSHVEGLPVPDSGTWVRLKAGEGDAAQLREYVSSVGAEALVLDHYGVDEAYQQALLAAGRPWLQFEGRPRQRLWARWVLAANPEAVRERYVPWLQSPESQLLLGPAYAILNPEFLQTERRPYVGREVREVAISLGGGWDRGGIQPCLDALAHRRERIRVQVLTTAANPSAPALQAWAAEHGRGWVDVRIDAGDFATRLAAADLAIIAGGTTTFEAAYLGIPALIIQIADNQAGQAAAWSRLGVAEDLGPLATLDSRRLAAALDGIIADSERRKHMSDAGRALVDGQGVYRVADAFVKGLELETNLLS